MKYIDKKLHKAEGEQIVSEFLQCIHQRLGAYPEELYKNFGQEIDDAHGHVIFRARLQNEVLEPEQEGVCCYCLRKLDNCNHRTIEHLIRNHAESQEEMDSYRTRPTELDGLVWSRVFTSDKNPIYPPYPHSVAYQNLVVSCDGDLFNENSKPVSCNLKRGKAFVPPFVLYEDIADRFVYYPDGTADWLDDPNGSIGRKSVVSILGLNKPVLKMIRRIWFYIASHRINIAITSKEDLVNEIYGNLVGPDFSESETKMLFNFKVEKYWNLFLQYEAFASINPV